MVMYLSKEGFVEHKVGYSCNTIQGVKAIVKDLTQNSNNVSDFEVIDVGLKKLCGNETCVTSGDFCYPKPEWIDKYYEENEDTEVCINYGQCLDCIIYVSYNKSECVYSVAVELV